MTQSVDKHNVKWQVSLSNGETFFEEKGRFEIIDGEKSPWQRLLAYAIENKLEITSLSLYTNDGRTFNLPSLGKNPKFRAFASVDKPLDYNVCRNIARDMTIEDAKANDVVISDHFTVAEAIYPTYRVQLWVDEKNTQNCWVLVIPNN